MDDDKPVEFDGKALGEALRVVALQMRALGFVSAHVFDDGTSRWMDAEQTMGLTSCDRERREAVAAAGARAAANIAAFAELRQLRERVTELTRERDQARQSAYELEEKNHRLKYDLAQLQSTVQEFQPKVVEHARLTHPTRDDSPVMMLRCAWSALEIPADVLEGNGDLNWASDTRRARRLILGALVRLGFTGYGYPGGTLCAGPQEGRSKD